MVCFSGDAVESFSGELMVLIEIRFPNAEVSSCGFSC